MSGRRRPWSRRRRRHRPPGAASLARLRLAPAAPPPPAPGAPPRPAPAAPVAKAAPPPPRPAAAPTAPPAKPPSGALLPKAANGAPPPREPHPAAAANAPFGSDEDFQPDIPGNGGAAATISSWSSTEPSSSDLGRYNAGALTNPEAEAAANVAIAGEGKRRKLPPPVAIGWGALALFLADHRRLGCAWRRRPWSRYCQAPIGSMR